MFYVSLMVTTTEKPIVDSHKIKRGESMHITEENYQFTKKGKRGRKEQGNCKKGRKQ